MLGIILGIVLSAYGITWDDPCLTHSGPPELDILVSRALNEWTSDCGSGTDVVIRWTTPEDATGWAAVHGFGEIVHCEVGINPLLDPKHLNTYYVVIHEVGHCLGLGHPHESGDFSASVMNSPYHGMTDYDRSTIRALYPPAYRMVSPGLVFSGR